MEASSSRAIVERIIIEAGKSIGKSKEDVDPFIHKIIDANWIDSPEAFEATAPSQLREMGIPLRLVDAIYRRLETLKAQTAVSADNTATQSQAVHEDINGIDHTGFSKDSPRTVDYPSKESPDVLKVAYETPSSLPVLETVSSCCTRLAEDCSESPEKLRTALRTLLKIIDGVLTNPQNPQKRCLRLSNPVFHNRVGQFPSGVALLKGVGFEERNKGVLELPVAYISRLTDTHQLIAASLRSLGAEAPPVPSSVGFNPYRATISSQNQALAQPGPLRNLYEARVKELSSIEEVKIPKAETELRTGGGTTAVLPENPKVFRLGSLGQCNTSSEKAADEGGSQPPEPWLTPDLLRKIQTNTLGRDTFKSQTKERLEALLRQKVFTKCVLRIHFPDDVMLELTFSPSTALSEVYKSVSKYLDVNVKNSRWCLFETPPHRVIAAGRQTLYEEHFVPGAVVHFKVEGEDKERRSTYLAQDWMKFLQHTT